METNDFFGWADKYVSYFFSILPWFLSVFRAPSANACFFLNHRIVLKAEGNSLKKFLHFSLVCKRVLRRPPIFFLW